MAFKRKGTTHVYRKPALLALLALLSPSPATPSDPAESFVVGGLGMRVDPLAECRSAVEEGRRLPAILACRSAHEKDGSDVAALGLALALTLEPSPGTEPPTRDVNEAVDLARAVVNRDPGVADHHAVLCDVAIAGRRYEQLDMCAPALLRLAPEKASSHFYSFIRSVTQGHLAVARTHLEQAHALGMTEENYAGWSAVLDGLVPWWKKAAPIAGLVVLAWLAAFGLLLGLGLVLSAVTARAAASLPATAHGSAGAGSRLRAAYRGVLWLSCAFYYASLPLLLVVVLAAGAGLIWSFFLIGRIPVQLVAVIAVVTLGTAWAIVKSLFVRGQDADPGEKLDLAEHPRFRAFLDEVAAKVGTRPVDNVYLTADTDLAVLERGGVARQLRGKPERCLVLGVGVLEGFKRGPFRAVLAHEYGHFSNRDTAGGGFALAVRRSMMNMAQALGESGAATWYNPAWLFLTGFYKVFLRVSQGASRLQEVLADRWAAFSYGAAAFEEGLRHAIARTVRFDAHMQGTLHEVIEAKRGLLNLYALRPAVQPPEEALALGFEQSWNREPSPYDSHPRPVDRIALVHRLDAPVSAASDDGEEVWPLFTDRAAIEQRLTDHVRGIVAVHYGVAIPSADPVSAEVVQVQTGTGAG